MATLFFESEQYNELLARTERHIETYMAQYKDPSHDWTHIIRVRKVALQIAQTTPSVNTQLVELASLLHDVGDKKFYIGMSSLSEILTSVFNTIGIPVEMHAPLIWIIQRVSFRTETEAIAAGIIEDTTAPGTYFPELHCVQDADRLDAIGAIGISRCLCYTGARNSPLYELDVAPIIIPGVYPASSNARNHFYEKLFKIKSMLKTEAGRELGQRRHQVMINFIKELDCECDLDPSLLDQYC